ncbi:MAG: hypothetical protein NVS3B3_24750 [Aquirhabdus sp.]
MEELLFVILQFFGEILLQLIVELLVEIGWHNKGFLREIGRHVLSEPFRRKPEPWLAFIGYAIFGTIAGGLSLLLFPFHLIASSVLQFIGLFSTPLVVGSIMMCVGAWRRRRGEELVRLDRFAYSFIFAFTMGMIRFVFAH